MSKPETLEEAKARVAAEAKLKKEAEAEADKIMNASEEEIAKEDEGPILADFESAFVGDSDKVDHAANHREKAEAAYTKLRTVTVSYPATTPNEHTVFGYGDIRIQLGDLRTLFGLPS